MLPTSTVSIVILKDYASYYQKYWENVYFRVKGNPLKRDTFNLIKSSLHYVYFSYFSLDQDLNPGFRSRGYLGNVRLWVPEASRTFQGDSGIHLVSL